MCIMEIFGNPREVCRYPREKLNGFATLRDINNVGITFRLLDHRENVVRMKALLRRQGTLRLLKLEDLVRIVFGI